MHSRDFGKVIGHLLRENAADAELLDRYIRLKEDAAFTALVRRHGRMVWGVCSRILPRHEDAEDAFQATFLLLLRKADALQAPGKVGNWLYGTAHRTALATRKAIRKRREKEAQAVPVAREPQTELREVIDHELVRLPEKYRTLIVLCDLEERTLKEAARQLGLAEGTVASRLSRGRALLAKRLLRYGLSLAAGTKLSQAVGSASAPAELIAATLKTATNPAAAAGVVALVEGVMTAMMLTKIKVGAAVLLAVAVGGSGYAVFTHAESAEQETTQTPPIQAVEQPAKQEPDQPKPDPTANGAGSLGAARKARLAAARNAYDKVWTQYREGYGDEEQVYRWSLRLLEAEQALDAFRQSERIMALIGHLDRMKELEKTAPDRLIAVDIPANRPRGDFLQFGNKAAQKPAPIRLGPEPKLLVDKDGNFVRMANPNRRPDGIPDIRPHGVPDVTAFYRAEAEVWLAEAKAK
jgi:RNA polymerase sigma factor (sigma-70 family)